MKNRRRRHFIYRSFQFRYAMYVSLTLMMVGLTVGVSIYYGAWTSMIKAFSTHSLQERILTASRLQDYYAARASEKTDEVTIPSIRMFREVDLLSKRDQEVLQGILTETNQRMLPYWILLILFIGWGSIFLTHKLAGPIYRLKNCLSDVGRGNLRLRIRFRKWDDGRDVALHFNHMTTALDESISEIKRLAEGLPKTVSSEQLKKHLAQFKTSS